MTVSDIARFAGDTYPSKTTIKVNGVPTDLTGWDVNLRYRLDDGTVKVIDCIIADYKNGKVYIYPHHRNVTDAPLLNEDFITDEMAGTDDGSGGVYGDSNQCWTNADEGSAYPFSIVRKKKFADYEEVMTHASGIVYISARV